MSEHYQPSPEEMGVDQPAPEQEPELAMTELTKATDLDKFAGQMIAFEIGDTLGQMRRDRGHVPVDGVDHNLGYGVVSIYSNPWSHTEGNNMGHGLTPVKTPDKVSDAFALVDEFLEKAKMSARLATEAEKESIIKAIQSGQIRLEYGQVNPDGTFSGVG